ncbi:ABC transporter permease [Neorhizobium sp. P12A]|uniref:ABC transporter permease n=1 Tax=Neorhizobium sp. P12A TaxID=2268027 RepID=UPI0011EC5BBB|nr:ABC transporter permease [Neorhizobium sp. P12A]KAA0693361.1 ABC transporter permease [Neorhizobium sp. P12A]
MTMDVSGNESSRVAARIAWLGELLTQPAGAAGFALIVFVLAIAAAATWIAPFDPNEQFANLQLSPPGVMGHLLGTDELSRDILSRVVFGTRVSIAAGFLSVAAGACIGIALGMIGGILRGSVDAFIMRSCDFLLAVPGILLGIVIVAVLGPGLLQVCIAVAIVNVPVFARLMRAAVLKERELDYVRASIVQGASTARILLRHILPNSVSGVITQFSAATGQAVLMEASLSFLGLGVQPPAASWGSMLSKSRDYLSSSPLYALAPGIMLFLFVLGLNLLSDALQRLLNPAERRR